MLEKLNPDRAGIDTLYNASSQARNLVHGCCVLKSALLSVSIRGLIAQRGH